ncbi:MAG TPA: DUF2231 domain-containing protein [Candidatus Binataceae bacterium]|nr:DUF2231 domain-containing protein [Candidatus Binataceae bacterium]
MDKIAQELVRWHIHPIVDHFTIALLVVALLIDIAASILAERLWLRYMALTLMVLGAISAVCSWFTGGGEAHATFKYLDPAGQAVLHIHSQLGNALAITFAVLALWRILIQALGFMARTRQVYLALAFLAVILLGYQGWLGGELVYGFGAGTALLTSGAQASAQTPPSTSKVAPLPSAIPTVYVPMPSATAQPRASAAASAVAPISSPQPSATASALPTGGAS